MAYKTRVIVEILGYPEDHLKKVMENVVIQIKNDKDIKLIKSDIGDIEKTEKGIFSSFMELEIELKDLLKLSQFCFDYMPSSIEVVDIEDIQLKSIDLNNMLNDFLNKLHQYNLALNNAVAKYKELEKLNKKPTA